MSGVKVSIPGEMQYIKIPRAVATIFAAEMGFLPGRVEDIRTAISELLSTIIAPELRGESADLMIDTTFFVETNTLIFKVLDPDSRIDQILAPEPPPPKHRYIGLNTILPELADKIEITSTPDGTEVVIEFYLE